MQTGTRLARTRRPKIYDSLDWLEGEDINDYDLMWTKMERAVSPECNEIVASKKFKERMQKPGETITVFITDLMLGPKLS